MLIIVSHHIDIDSIAYIIHEPLSTFISSNCLWVIAYEWAIGLAIMMGQPTYQAQWLTPSPWVATAPPPAPRQQRRFQRHAHLGRPRSGRLRAERLRIDGRRWRHQGRADDPWWGELELLGVGLELARSMMVEGGWLMWVELVSWLVKSGCKVQSAVTDSLLWSLAINICQQCKYTGITRQFWATVDSRMTNWPMIVENKELLSTG